MIGESNMSKVVILGGNARSGKSTLSYQLMKKGFNRISFDHIYTAIEEGFKIKIDDLSDEKKFSFFESIVNTSVEEAELEKINTVIDMYDFLPQDIMRLKNKDKVEVYFLAYPNCNQNEIKYNIIHYAKPTDWIAKVNESYLEECVIRFDNRNKLLVRECQKYNMNLIDTSSGKTRDIVLHNLCNSILEKK